MIVGGDYDSPQKQAVRERLWDPAIADLVANHGRKADELRFMDLPGADCLYLKQIIERFGILKDNIVAVERFEEPRLAIHRFLGGRGVVRLGALENLCDSGELKKYFPVDIANLDFCGQGFVFPVPDKRTKESLPYQRRWDSIKRVIDFNREREQPAWYLLLTLGCDRNNGAGKAFLLDQLRDLAAITGIDKDPAGWRDDRLIQEVVPKIIADEALQRDYVPSAVALDSYRYVQVGHKFHMVAWRFKFTLDGEKTLGHSTTRRKRHLDGFCKTYFAAGGKELDG